LAPQLPHLRARDADGSERLLPRDIPTDPALVLFFLKQGQEKAVNHWVAALPETPALAIALKPRRRRLLRLRSRTRQRSGRGAPTPMSTDTSRASVNTARTRSSSPS
jgi:hypothetical protein